MIAIGDVHGMFDLLLKLIDKLPKNNELCFLGDLIDRGPESKEVVDYVRDNNHLCVMGNHEDMMLDAFTHIESENIWIYNGGG